MNRSVILSGGLHLLLILILLFSGQIFSSDEVRAIQIAEVDIITGEEFDAAQSAAPDAPREVLPDLTPPEAGGSDVVAPDAVEPPSAQAPDAPEAPATEAAETAPDVSAVRDRAQVTAAPEPAQPSQGEPEGASSVIAPVGPTAPETARPTIAPSLTRPAPPRPAPRIADTPAPPPPTDARTADTATPEVAPGETAVEPQEEKPAEAPPEAATEIVPEVAEPVTEPEAVAPLTAARPRGRPDVQTAEATPPPAAPETQTETQTAAAEPVRAATPATQARPAREAATPRPARTPDVPVGAPLTAREKDGITLAVKKNWNVGPFQGRPDFRELIVTVRFELDQAGNVLGGKVEPVTPASPSGPYKLAYDAARRAVLRSAPFRMPPEKFGRWKVVEITFNPSKGIGY